MKYGTNMLSNRDTSPLKKKRKKKSNRDTSRVVNHLSENNIISQLQSCRYKEIPNADYCLLRKIRIGPDQAFISLDQFDRAQNDLQH